MFVRTLRSRRARLAAAALAVTAGLTMVASTALAADHTDPPAVADDAAADIADVYSWVNGDNIVLAMTISAPQFSDATQYVFHVSSSAGLAQAPGASVDIICTFDAAQVAQCWVGDQDYVTGDASAEAGLTSDSGMVTLFSGPRDDPFFFNITGFNDTVDAVVAAATGDPPLTFDAAGCPELDQATSDALVGLLSTGSDDFAGNTVGAIVLEVDKTLLNGGGDVLAVYGATYGQ